MTEPKIGFAFIGLCLALLGCNHSPVNNGLLKFAPCPSPVVPPASVSNQRVYNFATGSPSGTYVKLGAAISGAVADSNPAIHLEPRTTQGSVENLELLRSGSVNFALVQMDSLHDEILHSPKSPISLVTFLYSEKLHFFVRPHFYISSPADLRRICDKRKIWLGPRKSGTYKTATRVLEAAGLSDCEIAKLGNEYKCATGKDSPQGAALTEQGLNWGAAAQGLLEPDPDVPCALYAYFQTMAVPGRFRAEEGEKWSVEKMLKADAQIVPLSSTIIDRLAEDKLYVATAIKLGSYKNLKRGVPTVGISTVLVTNLPGDYEPIVKNLICQIKKKKKTIEDQIGGIELDQLNAAIREATLQDNIHAGALDHLRVKSSGVIWLVPLGLAIGALFAFHQNPHRVRRKLATWSYGLLLVGILGVLWLAFSLVLMLTEGTLNPDFHSLGGSLANTFLSVSGQLREYRLMTRRGEIVLWLGLFFLPLIFGWLISDVLKALLRRASERLGEAIQVGGPRDLFRWLARVAKRFIDGVLRKSQPTRGSLVFLNWNERAERMLREFRQDAEFADRKIVIVRSEASQPPTNGTPQGATIVDGDPTTRGAMEKAGIVQAAAVTILSAWAPPDPNDRRRNVDPDTADTKTILAILAIRTLCEELQRSTVLPIKAEIRLSRNQEEVKNAIHGGKIDLTCLSV